LHSKAKLDTIGLALIEDGPWVLIYAIFLGFWYIGFRGSRLRKPPPAPCFGGQARPGHACVACLKLGLYTVSILRWLSRH